LQIGLAAMLFGFLRALGNVYSGFDLLTRLELPSVVYNMLPYVIALGVNDIYNVGMEIGSIADIGSDRETFVGYYAEIVRRYREISPGAKFFFVTFPNTNTPERDHQTHGMIRALYELAEYFGNSYVIDLYRYGPVYDDAFKRRFFLYGHMNPDGYLFTAELIDSYIDYIVRHNPDDFKTIGFVTTNIPY
jgi:hypothetical protein